jgi:hypothetical protein
MQEDAPVTVNGIGRKQLVVAQTGYLNEFFWVYARLQARPNVLSLADVEDMFTVTYIPGQAFIVHSPSHGLEFKCKGKLYVANYHPVLNPKPGVHVTVQENEDVHTCTKVHKAKAA